MKGNHQMRKKGQKAKRSVALILSAAGILLVIILFFSGLTLFRLSEQQKFTLEKMTNVSEEDVLEGYHDLSSEGSREYKGSCDQEHAAVINEEFMTNSTQIKVTNLSDVTLEVRLMHATDEELVIQQFNLENKGTKVFTNLTAAKLYKIAIMASGKAEYAVEVSE